MVLQLPQPVAQAKVQVLLAQLGVAWFVLHATLQPPQLVTSALTARSQPSL
jgi:hypothetical protein